jgi:hypothetical protein
VTNQHPITPPPELVQQWYNDARDASVSTFQIDMLVAARAAQWGADQELEACCQHVQKDVTEFTGHAHLCAQRKSDGLRAARRPKPPSLKEQALETVIRLGKKYPSYEGADIETIRRALEALPE